MFKNSTTQSEKTVRIVIKVNPYTAAKIKKIPARKRSRFIEESVLKRIEDEDREYAFQHMLKVSDSIKVKTSMKDIVRKLRKDRQSH